eukprot:1194394-Prorocentrum_minimum.AAC.4
MKNNPKNKQVNNIRYVITYSYCKTLCILLFFFVVVIFIRLPVDKSHPPERGGEREGRGEQEPEHERRQLALRLRWRRAVIGQLRAPPRGAHRERQVAEGVERGGGRQRGGPLPPPHDRHQLEHRTVRPLARLLRRAVA